jgi:acetyl esterase/lipase
MMAKDDPTIELAAQFLHYGLYNARRDFTPPARIELGSDGTFQPSQAQIHAVLDHYARTEDDRDHPWMSPLLADDYSGLCPASITSGGFDTLRDDGALYARRLREHGIQADYRCWVTCIHGYFNWGAQLGDVSEEAFAHFIEQAKELLGSEDAAAGMQHVTETRPLGDYPQT